MDPFREWLSKQRQTEEIFLNLEASNKSFSDFIARQKAKSQAAFAHSPGLKALLASPFQRVSRYNLMIDRKYS
jgi:hypothetical protein